MTPEEWPLNEDPPRFDWSLSMKQIEKQYAPAPIVQPKAKYVPPKAETQPGTPDERLRKQYWRLMGKYEHFHEMLIKANPDLPRWIFDNLITKLK